VKRFAIITVLALSLHLTLGAEVPSGSDPQFNTMRNEGQSPEVEMEHKMARDAAKERQKKLQQDTDKLLQLAIELKQSVDKSNEHTLSLEVIRKTEEIDKLSKSIRDKMKAGEF